MAFQDRLSPNSTFYSTPSQDISFKTAITMANQASMTNNLDLRYWMRHSVPPLLALLRAAGSYSDADQGKHIQFLCDYVLPNFGPRPTDDSSSKSWFTQSGFPMDLSLNLNAGKPKVRYAW